MDRLIDVLLIAVIAAVIATGVLLAAAVRGLIRHFTQPRIIAVSQQKGGLHAHAARRPERRRAS